MPPATFVRGQRATNPGGDPGNSLRLVNLEAEDGASRPWTWQNAGIEDCVSARLTDGRFRCVPATADPHTDEYADMSCQKPATTVPVACLPAPTLVGELTDACTSTFAVRLEPAVPKLFGLDERGRCNERYSDPPRLYHPIGDVVPPDSFPTVGETMEDASGRLRRGLAGPAADPGVRRLVRHPGPGRLRGRDTGPTTARCVVQPTPVEPSASRIAIAAAGLESQARVRQQDPDNPQSEELPAPRLVLHPGRTAHRRRVREDRQPRWLLRARRLYAHVGRARGDVVQAGPDARG